MPAEHATLTPQPPETFGHQVSLIVLTVLSTAWLFETAAPCVSISRPPLAMCSGGFMFSGCLVVWPSIH